MVSFLHQDRAHTVVSSMGFAGIYFCRYIIYVIKESLLAVVFCDEHHVFGTLKVCFYWNKHKKSDYTHSNGSIVEKTPVIYLTPAQTYKKVAYIPIYIVRANLR